MSKQPAHRSALGKFEMTLPPELYLMIAEHLGHHIIQEKVEDLVLGDTDSEDSDEDVDHEIVQITTYLRQSFPTLSMLQASMVNKYFREMILAIALRWDAQSENPKAVYHAAAHNLTNLLENALRHSPGAINKVPVGKNIPSLPPVMLAAYKGYPEVVKTLLKYGADVEKTVAWAPYWRTAPFVESRTTMLENAMLVNLFTVWTSLHCALFAPQSATEIANMVLECLSDEFNETIADPTHSFLALAVASDLIDLVGPLIRRGAKLNHGGRTVHSMSTPVLHHAVSGGMVRRLVDAGANVHTPPELGLNALHAVCLRQNDCTSAIRELVKRGVDVNEPTGGGFQRLELLKQPTLYPLTGMIPQTALNLACRQLNLPHIRLLLELGASAVGTGHLASNYTLSLDGDYYQASPFHDLFLPENLHRNPLAGDGDALRDAITGAVTCLLRHGGAEALYRRHAVGIGPLPHDRGKIDRSFWAEPNSTWFDIGEYTPFELFFMQPLVDDERIPEAMFNACDNVLEQVNTRLNPYGVTPLIALLSHRFDHSHGEANFYRPKLVKWLLQHGADPNMTDLEGFTPLHYAVFWLDATAVALLLEYGAKTKVPAINSHTALEVAVGCVYAKRHSQRRTDTAWKSMVKLMDQWGKDPYGQDSCIRRWKPEYPLPACALPGSEYMFILMGDDDDDELPESLRGQCVQELRRHADIRRREIFELLLPRTEIRAPLAIAQKNEAGLNVIPSVLDWACATGQREWFVTALVEAGARMGHYAPDVHHHYMSERNIEMNWWKWKGRCGLEFTEAA